ncbi:hypothetical protein ACLB2K_013773 [Fragaria x ananassa]
MALGAIEGISKFVTGSLISLLEQKLMDCNKGLTTKGCRGGQGALEVVMGKVVNCNFCFFEVNGLQKVTEIRYEEAEADAASFMEAQKGEYVASSCDVATMNWKDGLAKYETEGSPGPAKGIN